MLILAAGGMIPYLSSVPRPPQHFTVRLVRLSTYFLYYDYMGQFPQDWEKVAFSYFTCGQPACKIYVLYHFPV